MKDNRLSGSNSERNVGHCLVHSIFLKMEAWRPGKEGDVFKLTWLLSGAVWFELTSESAEELPPPIHADHIFILKASHLFFWLYRLLMAGGAGELQAEVLPCCPWLHRLGLCGPVFKAESRHTLGAGAVLPMYRQDMFSFMSCWCLHLPDGMEDWGFTSWLFTKLKTPFRFLLKVFWNGKCLTTPLLALPLCAGCNDPERINWTLHFKDKDWDFTSG